MESRLISSRPVATLVLLPGVVLFTSACAGGQTDTSSPSYQAGYHVVADQAGTAVPPGPQVDINYICRSDLKGAVESYPDMASMGLHPTKVTDSSAFLKGCADAFHMLLEPRGYTFDPNGIAKASR